MSWWLAPTLAFALGFRRFVERKTGAQMLDAYNLVVRPGWPVVLLVILLMPIVTGS